MGRTIVVAIDGYTHARRAFNWLLGNMELSGDTVILVHVVENNISIGLPGRAANVDEICAQMKKKHDEIGNMTDDYMNVLRAKHIQAKLLLLQGHKPGEAIIKAAHDEKADLIIMGSRGLGAFGRTWVGSVSNYVVNHAHCPVTIVKQGEENIKNQQ